ncbi:MAG: BrnA antitoxin family protein [Caldilineaceae bacterium]
MSTQASNNTSKTDWDWLEADTDESIDYSDVPPLSDSFFEHAQLRLPGKKISITLKIDPEILAWFKAQNGDYQHRMNIALRIYAEAHQEQKFSVPHNAYALREIT